MFNHGCNIIKKPQITTPNWTLLCDSGSHGKTVRVQSQQGFRPLAFICRYIPGVVSVYQKDVGLVIWVTNSPDKRWTRTQLTVTWSVYVLLHFYDNSFTNCMSHYSRSCLKQNIKCPRFAVYYCVTNRAPVTYTASVVQIKTWAPSQYKDRLISVWRFPC